MGLNDFLLSGIISHKVDLLRFSESVRSMIVNLLTDVGEDLQNRISDADLAGITRTSTKQARQEALIKQAAGTVISAFRSADETLDNQLLELSEVSQDFGVSLLNDAFKASVTSTSLTPKDLSTLVSNTLIEGAPSADWWSKQSADLQHRFAQQIRMGVVNGETNDDIVRRIRGQYDGTRSVIDLPDGTSTTVRNFTGGIMDVSKRDATSLVRTSVQAVSNKVLDETYKDNSDVLNGRMWVSTLDLRTTPICRALDKGCWDWEGKPLPNSPVKRSFPGPPPIHFQCRSVLAPITKSWEQLIAEAGGKTPKGSIADIPPSVRASMDGTVAADLTYEDWLKKQSVSRQKEVLGEGKWDLWSKGKLTFQEMVDQSGNPLSLTELQDKVANA